LDQQQNLEQLDSIFALDHQVWILKEDLRPQDTDFGEALDAEQSHQVLVDEVEVFAQAVVSISLPDLHWLDADM
jgi:hypothetical protein